MREMAQMMRLTRHLGLMYVFFFLMCFFIIGSCIIGFTYQLMMEKVVTRETGPNDASDTLFGPYVHVF